MSLVEFVYTSVLCRCLHSRVSPPAPGWNVIVTTVIVIIIAFILLLVRRRRLLVDLGAVVGRVPPPSLRGDAAVVGLAMLVNLHRCAPRCPRRCRLGRAATPSGPATCGCRPGLGAPRPPPCCTKCLNSTRRPTTVAWRAMPTERLRSLLGAIKIRCPSGVLSR